MYTHQRLVATGFPIQQLLMLGPKYLFFINYDADVILNYPLNIKVRLQSCLFIYLFILFAS